MRYELFVSYLITVVVQVCRQPLESVLMTSVVSALFSSAL